MAKRLMMPRVAPPLNLPAIRPAGQELRWPATDGSLRRLTVKQEAFCQAYALSGKGAESARLAGYGVKNADVAAQRLLRSAVLVERIEALHKERNVTDESFVLSQRRAYLQRLSDIVMQGKDRESIAAASVLLRLVAPIPAAQLVAMTPSQRIERLKQVQKEKAELIRELGAVEAANARLSQSSITAPSLNDLPKLAEDGMGEKTQGTGTVGIAMVSDLGAVEPSQIDGGEGGEGGESPTTSEAEAKERGITPPHFAHLPTQGEQP